MSHMYYQWEKQGDNQDASCHTTGGVIQTCLIIPEAILDEYVNWTVSGAEGTRIFFTYVIPH